MPKVTIPKIDLEADVMDLFHKSVTNNVHAMIKGVFTEKAARFLGSRLRLTVHHSDQGSMVLIRFFYENYLELESHITSSGQVDFTFKKLTLKAFTAALEDQGWDLQDIQNRLDGLKAIQDMFDLPVKINTPQVAVQFTQKGLPFMVGLINRALHLA